MISPCGKQGARELQRMRDEHIVIGQPMDEQEWPLQFVGPHQ
jgi:hypothetical protein